MHRNPQRTAESIAGNARELGRQVATSDHTSALETIELLRAQLDMLAAELGHPCHSTVVLRSAVEAATGGVEGDAA